MHLSIEYFSNSCEDLIDKYLSFLSDAQQQQKFWVESSSNSLSSLDFVELMITDIDKLFATAEYKHYANCEALLLLKELFKQVEGFYINIETAAQLSNKDKLLNDPQWIKIHNLSKKVATDLRIFISQLRSKGSIKNA